MEEAKFTWSPRLTRTAAIVPEEERGALLRAVALYLRAFGTRSGKAR
jgi:hypothetical protein